MIDILKILFTMPFLFYSCYTDLKERRVSNKVWKYMLASGSVFVIYEVFTGGVPYLKALIFSGVVVFPFDLHPFPARSFRGRGCKGADSAFYLISALSDFPVLGKGLSPARAAPDRALCLHGAGKCSSGNRPCASRDVLLQTSCTSRPGCSKNPSTCFSGTGLMCPP